LSVIISCNDAITDADAGVTEAAAIAPVSTAPTVTVAALAPTDLRIWPTGVVLDPGRTVTLTAGNAWGALAPTTWSSSDPTIASVVNVGSRGHVTGRRGGRVMITARWNTSIATTMVDVTGGEIPPPPPPPPPPTPVIASVVTTPASASLVSGNSVQLSAQARDSAGAVISGVSFTWSSSNTAAATVSATGNVTGVGAGTAQIRASAGGLSGTTNVTVTPAAPVIASVLVTPSSVSVESGSSVQLTAQARDANGIPISGVTYSWSSNNTQVATVSGSGNVSGVSAGIAMISATAGGHTGAASVNVSAPPPPPPPPPPGEGNVVFGSDWGTATGNSLLAVTDGGKWTFVSAEYTQTMNIVASTGLDFPTSNVYQVIATSARSGWSELRHTALPIPAVNTIRSYRWYMRVTMPDGLVDDQTHPVQDNYLENWGFIVYNGGGGAGVPNGRWRPEFWSLNSGWPNDRWRGPNLNKNQTYRIEMQIERIGTTTYRMHVRIYDSAGTLVADDNAFNNNQGTARLSSNPTLTLGNVNALNGITAGNNGIGDNAPFPFTYAYQGGFAVCSGGWCGPYVRGEGN
jgi:uncharacterized protein YjdB